MKKKATSWKIVLRQSILEYALTRHQEVALTTTVQSSFLLYIDSICMFHWICPWLSIDPATILLPPLEMPDISSFSDFYQHYCQILTRIQSRSRAPLPYATIFFFKTTYKHFDLLFCCYFGLCVFSIHIHLTHNFSPSHTVVPGNYARAS